MDSGGGAFGAGKAGGAFDPLTFIKKPQVILRALSWLFAVIVFGCIASKGSHENICRYSLDNNACAFGVGIGVLAFLGVMGFLILDALFENISSIQQRKYVVIADIAFSGLWAFLWFVCFCYLTNKWKPGNLPPGYLDQPGSKSACEAAIAFSFFSIGTFAACTYFAVMKYRAGIAEDFTQSEYDPNAMGGPQQPTPSPYSAYPSGGEGADPYQQSPFGGQPQEKSGGMSGGPGDFQPPTY